jgi:hypothetical protein
MSYTDAGAVVDTLMHILNNEQEFFRDYIRQYDQDVADREYPLSVTKGIFDNRPHSVMPILELEPDSEENEWAATQAQRPTFDVTLRLTVVNANRELSVEYLTGLVRRIKIILNDPRRLQSLVIDAYGRQQMKWTSDGCLLPINFLDSLVTRVEYKSLQEGTLRQATMSWFCKIHEPLPAKSFFDHWPHWTSPTSPGYFGPGKA